MSVLQSHIEEIQEQLRKQKLDGWLFFDHHQRDPLAYRVLRFTPERHVTRRWYYLIPAQGEPLKLVHRIERGMLDTLPGERVEYSSWTEQVDGLRKLLLGTQRVAMQYSRNCAIPYVAMVDAGTIELVRSLGIEVAGSAELIQHFEARWTPEDLENHLEAGRRVDRVRRAAFDLVRERTRAGGAIQEYEVKRFVLEAFARAGLTTMDGPIVGVNANAANPHYEPTAEVSSEIRAGDFVLMDMWAKLDRPGAVYYDITWTGFCGDTPGDEMRRVFETVRDARDAAIRRVQTAVAAGQTLRGFEVDDAARGLIASRGYGQWFTHRTGHSIGQEVHGNGANMDNLETHDERPIVPWTCFSIEPGVYPGPFGVRSEVNVFVGEGDARVTGEIQRELLTL
ncbi:MAG TPA: Xaa-Pro peptidase family protein [Bryobacteraceae bacterium]|nr:Xaa-Pro peptidase family protein [Bryobacteraceae bacterium]